MPGQASFQDSLPRTQVPPVHQVPAQQAGPGARHHFPVMTLRWRGIAITDNGAKELFHLYDIVRYLEALRDGNISEPGVPQLVNDAISEECRILLKNLEPYRTDE